MYLATERGLAPGFRILKSGAVLAILLAASAGVHGQTTDPGLHLEGRYLVDGNGQHVLLRGPELVHRWGVYSGINSYGLDVAWEGGINNNVSSTTVREVAKTKCSAMRILGGIGNDLDDMLKTAIEEQKMYVSVARVDWKNAQMMATLKKYSNYIILHPRGEFTYTDANQWRTDALNAVKQIRALGYTNVMEIGTTGYGQTWSTIQKYGVEVAASDPLKKTMFLLQLYSELANNVTGTEDQIAAFPVPVTSDACLFTSTYGNTPNTYKQVWDESFKRNISSFYWDWWGDGTGASMTSNGQFTGLNAIGQYIVNQSPAALKNTVKGAYILNAPNGATTTPVPSPLDQMKIEAENAQLSGGAAAVGDAARSNGAYVNLQGGSIVWTDSLTKAGTYNIVLNMDSPYGPKTNTFAIDGDSTSFSVDSSVTFGPTTVATAVTLQPGKHTFTLKASWGWLDVDYLQLTTPTTGIRDIAHVGTPKAVPVSGGIQVERIDGIRQIRVMDASGRLLALSRPTGVSVRIPLSAHGLILVSFENEQGMVSSSKLVQP